MRLFHQKFNLKYFFLGGSSFCEPIQCLIVAADNFLIGCITTRLIVTDTVSGHIYTHICRGFVRVFSIYFFKNSTEHRENFHITIIIDSCDAVGFQMEWVDHIDVI